MSRGEERVVEVTCLLNQIASVKERVEMALGPHFIRTINCWEIDAVDAILKLRNGAELYREGLKEKKEA